MLTTVPTAEAKPELINIGQLLSEKGAANRRPEQEQIYEIKV